VGDKMHGKTSKAEPNKAYLSNKEPYERFTILGYDFYI